MEVVDVKLKAGNDCWKSKDEHRRLYAKTHENGVLEVGYKQTSKSVFAGMPMVKTLCVYAPGEWLSAKLYRPSDYGTLQFFQPQPPENPAFQSGA